MTDAADDPASLGNHIGTDIHCGTPSRSTPTSRAPRATDDSTRRVMDALRRIVRGLSASARVLPGGSSVSGAQLFVLRQIDEVPGLSIGELAARTLAGQS